MTSHKLPGRANLEQLKKQAKSLLQGARDKDPEALGRFQILPGRVEGEFALHHAQSVIAREYGFKSWNELRGHVVELSLSYAEAVDEFLRCATGGARDRAERLLERFPDIRHANFYAELVLGDVEAVEARLARNPEAARISGGAQDWEPILYVCHTSMAQSTPDRAERLARIARALLTRGANPNAEYHWNWHRELPRTALWGALCAVNHLQLAEVLLEGGANPTDGVSMHICAGQGWTEHLELLRRFGVNVNGIAGGVPPLRYVLAWARNTPERTAGIRWLLEHGADPNLAWNEPGDAPIHVAAQRWDVPMVELLVRHGADIHLQRADGRTAHTIASLYGNKEIAEWLLAHGATDELSSLERFVAACTQGDRTAAQSMLQANPGLRGELNREHHLMMQVPAERGDANVLETMLTCGFDPNVTDNEGITALHRAAGAGRAEAVRVLIEHGAPVNAPDGMFAGTPLLWASHGWSHSREGGQVEVARILIAAGASREWIPPEKMPDPEAAQEELAELCRAAEGVA